MKKRPAHSGGIMNARSEAIEQYSYALKQGKKYYNACIAKGVSPYPAVLDELLADQGNTATEKIGLVDIPADRIVGTWADGRKKAFAGNFMPLLDMNSEFGSKWVNLCEAHLGDQGIHDPITCFEYLGNFYVQEGNKRVSVLKSYDAPSIPGIVTRILPAPSEEKEVQVYQEFLKFYKLSKTYIVTFSQPGSFVKLQAALGLAPDQEWSDDARMSFTGDFRRFSAAFDQLNGEKLPLTAGDALLSYLKVHNFSELRKMTEDEIRASLSAIWPDIRLLAKGEPISVSTQPEEKEKGLLSRILTSSRTQVAFIYDSDPQKSPWASAHEQGQKYLEEKLGATVRVDGYLCGESPDETMENAIAQGANVVFATSPTLIDACRRIAAKHKNIAVFNCSLSMPYAGVRSYYCRIYEGKFITGAIAGAMAKEDRIGYVANYPIMGVTAAINAFALGVQMTNPRARISLKWSCLPGNPVREFLNDGISVVSNRDEDGAKPYLAWELGLYQINPDGKVCMLASAQWNWGIFYEKTVASIISGGVEALRDSNHAITDWWGIDTGVVDVDISAALPSGVRHLADILKKDIAGGRLHPFHSFIQDQSGAVINDGTRDFSLEELMRMPWLCGNIDGSIPAFDDLLPQSRNLVRLLGIYRDTIPPETKEAAI